MSLSREVNRTVFAENGTQLVTVNITFTSTDSLASGCVIDVPHTTQVHTRFIPGSVSTNAPTKWIDVYDQWVMFDFNQTEIRAGVPYTLSIISQVAPNGTPVEFIPRVSVSQTFYHNSTMGTLAPVGVMPADLLPKEVTMASAAVNVSGIWDFTLQHDIGATLDCVVQPASLAPSANFSGTPTSGTAPLTVRFSDTSTNTPTIWNWNFGDGSTVNATVQHPVHTYTAAGVYTVSLNATNDGGSNTSTKANFITVSVPAPVANFTANRTTGRVPLTVLFMDTSTNSPISWNWSFGEGSFSAQQHPTHTYTGIGNYSVSLKVTNSGGSNSTTRVNYITVTQSPPSATLYVTNVTGIGRNQTGTTGIYLNNSFNPKAGSATFKLYYNMSIITAQSAQIMSGGVVSTNLSSPITFAIATTSGIPNGNAWLANVTFRSEQNAETTSELGLILTTLDDISIPPQDLIGVTRIQNGTFKTGGGVQVNVFDASGNPLIADRIALESGTGTLSVTGVNSYRFNAVPTGTYQVNVTKSGYIGVNSTISYTAGSMRMLTATMVTHAYQPTVILAESGVALSGMTRIPPEQLNAKRNETDQYNLTLNGGGVISVALEYPMRYQLNRPQLNSALPVGTEMRNGTFLWTTPFYTTTNATLIMTATPVTGQSFVGLRFTGGKLGDVYYDTKVTSTDSLYDLHYVVTNLRSLSTYDYADVNRDGKITSTDALYILHFVVGNVNEYYQAV
jgi:PKD repeat protein